MLRQRWTPLHPATSSKRARQDADKMPVVLALVQAVQGGVSYSHRRAAVRHKRDQRKNPASAPRESNPRVRRRMWALLHAQPSWPRTAQAARRLKAPTGLAHVLVTDRGAVTQDWTGTCAAQLQAQAQTSHPGGAARQAGASALRPFTSWRWRWCVRGPGGWPWP